MSSSTTCSSSLVAAAPEQECSSTYIALFLPGAAQGTCSVALGHPFDTVKTRLQARGPQSAAAQHRCFRTLSTMVAMLRQEGVRSVYRGVVPPLIMIAAKRSVQLTLFDYLLSAQHVPQATASSLLVRAKSQLRGNGFVSGAIAGGAGTIVGCPLHVVKIQTQNSTKASTENAFTCAVSIFRIEGFAGFYRGWQHHLVKDVLFASMYLGSYNHIKQRHDVLEFILGPTLSSGETICTKESRVRINQFLSGSLASMLTWTVLFPVDAVKTCVQARRASTLSGVYVALGGCRGMYQGLGAALTRAGPVSGCAMLSYETVKAHTLAK